MKTCLDQFQKDLSLNIDLSKIKILKIFKWLKSKNISDKEMLRTFNCGVGFCLIAHKKNILKIKKIFLKDSCQKKLDILQKVVKKVNLSKILKW